jgi:hypothetical protein
MSQDVVTIKPEAGLAIEEIEVGGTRKLWGEPGPVPGGNSNETSISFRCRRADGKPFTIDQAVAASSLVRLHVQKVLLAFHPTDIPDAKDHLRAAIDAARHSLSQSGMDASEC